MNQINIGKEVKFFMFGIIGVTSIVTLVEMIFSPLPAKNLFIDQNFPEEISVSGIQVSSSNLPQHFDADRLKTIPGKSYAFKQNDASINIQMRYINTGYNVTTLLKKYTSLPHQSLEVLQQEEIGAYGILIYKNKLHLSSCITPQGSSIVSKANFYQSYPAFQLLTDRFTFWLLGEKPIVEKVCLWTHLSMPIEDSSPEKAYLTLEKVWFSWYEHWQPHLATIVNK